MSTDQTPTYHLAPNFSIPPSGKLQLGSIIEDLINVDPINEECRLDVPDEKITRHHVTGFESTRSDIRSGEYGIWAKFVGIQGLSGEAGWATEKTEEDTYKFEGLDTIYFNPNMSYIKDSMAKRDIQEYVEGLGRKPVFMITGLKIARGPAVSMTRRKKFAVTNELAIQPTEVPIETGAKANYSKETGRTVLFEKSDDFIVGMRVKMLIYKRHWLAWQRSKNPELVVEHYNKGAKLVDADDLGKSKADDDVLELDTDEPITAGKTEEVETQGEVKTRWIVPKE